MACHSMKSDLNDFGHVSFLNPYPAMILCLDHFLHLFSQFVPSID
jgi:hypothetical protein